MARPEHTIRPGAPTSPFFSDIKALESSILMISQKIEYLVRNEKILSQNLIVLNKRLGDLESRVAEGGIGTGGAGISSGDVENLQDKIDAISASLLKLQQRTAKLEEIINDIKNDYARISDLKELKYVIETISPYDIKKKRR